MNELLIQPKKLVINNEQHCFDANAAIYTNVKDINISYLLKLVGYTGEVRYKEFQTAKEYSVLLIGTDEWLQKTYEFDHPEKYYLEVGTDCILVAGKTPEDMILGLKGFIRISSEWEVLPTLSIEDYPDISFRSVHTCIFKPDDGTEKEITTVEYMKKMIQTAAISGYNHIFIEFWGMFPYSRDYAHWPDALTRVEVDEMVSFALDDMHIIPLPAQNMTTHAAWSRISSRKHTVLDQRPDMEHLYIPGGWCFATERPETKEFLKMVMDELVEAFRNPPYVHTGCDKAFGFGSTEEDRMVSADVLYVKHLSFLNGYLQTKNARMTMWSDMLYSSMDAFYWKCNEHAVNYLPKDILINVWTHNNPGMHWKDPAFFEDKNMETVYSPFMDEGSIESMVTLCRERGSKGIVQTTWHRPQSAVPYVILSGALQWCGKKPSKDKVEEIRNKWYR